MFVRGAMLPHSVTLRPAWIRWGNLENRQLIVKCKCGVGGLSVVAKQGDSRHLVNSVNKFVSKSVNRSCIKYTLKTRRQSPVSGAAVTETFGVTESGKFSLSDSALVDRGLELHSSSELLNLEQLNALFGKVGFPRRQEEKLARALEHSLSMFWLRDSKRGQLIAFARATGDDVFNAIIWDVVVDPSYQGSGLGKVVIERLMADLVKKGISNIALYAERDVVGFYKPLGFIADPDGIRAMAYSKRRR